MIEITLYQHTDTEDVDLGNCFVEALPPIGALIAMPSGVWRVTTMIVYPGMPGSASTRGRGQVGVFTLFGEPAEGPFHP